MTERQITHSHPTPRTDAMEAETDCLPHAETDRRLLRLCSDLERELAAAEANTLTAQESLTAVHKELAEANIRLAAANADCERLGTERDTANAALSNSRIPKGWQLVPKMPTHEMQGAALGHDPQDEQYVTAIWVGMLAAAPEAK
jgi:hypothetical protein